MAGTDHKRITVLGAGACGASIGADLTRVGHDVVLIDQWSAHVEAISISTPLQVRPLQSCARVP
jgi:2-dehydropantoate 2-reductase